jgi:hypothetical protein
MERSSTTGSASTGQDCARAIKQEYRRQILDAGLARVPLPPSR